VDAPELREALRAAAGKLTDEIAAAADLAEVRVQSAPDDRAYVEAG